MSSPDESDAGHDDGEDLLVELWNQFRPEFDARVRTVRSVAESLRSGPPPGDEDIAAAVSAAHRLAGSLGTFGRSEGSELAREAETLLRGLPLTPGEADRLVDLAARIEAGLDGPPPG